MTVELNFLKVAYPIYYLFLLVLAGLTDFWLDEVHKNSGFAYVVLEEGLKFVSQNGNRSLDHEFLFVLLLPKQKLFLEECDSKKNLIITLSIRLGKVVLALFDKVIVIYMGLMH